MMESKNACRFNRNGVCGCLINSSGSINCFNETHKCTFFQTVPEFAMSLEKSILRLRKLPIVKQKEISRKYYHNSMPWNDVP